jgi:hypothetical protein
MAEGARAGFRGRGLVVRRDDRVVEDDGHGNLLVRGRKPGYREMGFD